MARGGVMLTNGPFPDGPSRGDASPALHVSGPSADVLARWNAPGIRLALWHRDVVPRLRKHLDGLTLDGLPSLRLTTHLREAGQQITRALDLSDRRLATDLARDMSGLVSIFSHMTGLHDVEVRLDAVTDDACRRFHADNTRARLVSTYIGPGTIYVPAACEQDALTQNDAYSGPLHEMPRFAVGLFGGRKSDGGGFIHRSPRLEGEGRFRLFFCVTGF